jgi:hypothetical protein
MTHRLWMLIRLMQCVSIQNLLKSRREPIKLGTDLVSIVVLVPGELCYDLGTIAHLILTYLLVLIIILARLLEI